MCLCLSLFSALPNPLSLLSRSHALSISSPSYLSLSPSPPFPSLLTSVLLFQVSKPVAFLLQCGPTFPCSVVMYIWPLMLLLSVPEAWGPIKLTTPWAYIPLSSHSPPPLLPLSLSHSSLPLFPPSSLSLLPSPPLLSPLEPAIQISLYPQYCLHIKS